MDEKKGVGHLSINSSNGYKYICLRRSRHLRYENGKKKNANEHLYSFGRHDKALERMYSWRDNPDTFPEKLSDLGFGLPDLHEWILTMETKVKSNGKPFAV
ncbi:hypothetical protein U3A55_02400 [Salarchaeum sp. III]|uniref:hypothetical protein n=1 Tax=Salarchaeum sp. III TaxID=3107927 RepID=UPI002ED7BC5C